MWMAIITQALYVYLQDMIFSTVVALVYFCLSIPMAVFSTEWNNKENPVGNSWGLGDIPDDLSTISSSLAAAAVSY